MKDKIIYRLYEGGQCRAVLLRRRMGDPLGFRAQGLFMPTHVYLLGPDADKEDPAKEPAIFVELEDAINYLESNFPRWERATQ